MSDSHVSTKEPPVALGDSQESSFTLLQVEDNPANALLAEELIARRTGLSLITAITGYEGIEMACSGLPDLILMDINLYDINGLDALKVLRQNPDTAHIPVIALSSNAFSKQIEEGLKAGFFRYLTNPFSIKEFMATIDVALDFVTTIRSAKSS